MIIKEILDYLDGNALKYQFFGNPNAGITSFCPLKELKENSIVWARKLSKEVAFMVNSYGNMLLFLADCEEKKFLKCNYVIIDNPHRTFFQILEHFFYQRPTARTPKLSVIETDKIGKNISIGEMCYIGSDVVIGNDCIIGNNVTIEDHVHIGDRVIIDSGARIGVAGFGHYLNEDRTSTWIPHLGGVTIGSHVFIGANAVIARGTLSDTIIKDSVMIDMLCGIGHNAEIHERVIMAGGAGVAGSAIVKSDSWLAPGCIINAGVIVGENCLIGINSVVTHNIPDGKYAFGAPAKVIKDNNDTKYKI